MVIISNNLTLSFHRNFCLKPKDVVFNWPTKKDMPGTPKVQFPRTVVTPSARTGTKSVRKRKPIKTKCNVAAPPFPKLILDPDFWSPEPETPKARRQKTFFKCRIADCEEKFSSARFRDMHEENCFSFDKVCFLLHQFFCVIYNIHFVRSPVHVKILLE